MFYFKCYLPWRLVWSRLVSCHAFQHCKYFSKHQPKHSCEPWWLVFFIRVLKRLEFRLGNQRKKDNRLIFRIFSSIVITVIITLKCIGSEWGTELYTPSETTPALPTTRKIALLCDDLSVLLEWTHESSLFFDSLEATMTHLWGGIDELEVDIFQSSTAGLLENGLSESDCSLLWSHNTTLK